MDKTMLTVIIVISTIIVFIIEQIHFCRRIRKSNNEVKKSEAYCDLIVFKAKYNLLPNKKRLEKNSGYEEMVPSEFTHYLNIEGKMLVLTAEQAAELNKIIEEVKAEGKSEEVKEIENKETEQEIEEAKAIVKKAENQRDIPSYKEARLREKSYNNLHNEGGDGYVPHIVDKDEYNQALKVLGR